MSNSPQNQNRLLFMTLKESVLSARGMPAAEIQDSYNIATS